MTVSVLIPAFRAQFVGQAIASVLTQGYQDVEILISDDNRGDEVRQVVERFRDPRIRYMRTAGATGGTANLRALWAEARYDLLKYLFDDDLLLPNALVDLVDQVERRPEAAFVFGHRDVIDDRGRIKSEPRFVAANAVAALSRADLAGKIVPPCGNWIGEFSNILINRGRGVTLDDVYAYRGFDIEMLGDVAFYLNASSKGVAIGVGRTVGQFRKHESQNSSLKFNPLFYKAVCEWELFVRGEYAAGNLSAAQALVGTETLARLYGVFIGRLPQLAVLQAGLPSLRTRIEAENRDVLDEGFRAVWAGLKVTSPAGGTQPS